MPSNPCRVLLRPQLILLLVGLVSIGGCTQPPSPEADSSSAGGSTNDAKRGVEVALPGPVSCTIDGRDSTEIRAMKAAADELFNDHIKAMWLSSETWAWRSAWAMDSILDYFRICKIDGADFGKLMVSSALNPMHTAAWWDDFGWMGIAALRAAEQNVAPGSRDDLLKVAINSWAYMHGPGWTKADTKKIYPFDQLVGWDTFAGSHTPNIGAPNVWKDISTSWPSWQSQGGEALQRRFAGGTWNSPLKEGTYKPITAYKGGDGNQLAPVQNTVTNGLYAVLSLRIYLAAQNAEFHDVFQQAQFDADAALKAWQRQMSWFAQWMVEPDAEQAMLLGEENNQVLVRERASTFANGEWDPAFRKKLAWTGDQGLLLGALRESQFAIQAGQATTAQMWSILSIYPDIVSGVLKHGYHSRTYEGLDDDPNVTGKFLLPWIVIDGKNPFGYDPGVRAPGNDYSDYQTGHAVFMRYLLQAHRADGSLTEKFEAPILASAKHVAKGFGLPTDGGNCDALTSRALQHPFDELTGWVNRLSLLVTAIEMHGPGSKETAEGA